MSKYLNMRTLILVFLALLTTALHAETDTVLVDNFDYLPADITINEGDTVVFVWVAGTHPTAA